MRTPSILLAALLTTACGKSYTDAQRMAFDRATWETHMVLQYPDAAEWPTIDKTHFTQRGDTIGLMFTVLAPNGFGVKSSEMTMLDFLVDSCAHIVGGSIASERIKADPPGRPCDPASAALWDYDRNESEKDTSWMQ
jgi:hypothetical protein